MKGYIYLLESLNCLRPYLGSTIDLAKREIEHNQGVTKYTQNKGPWKIKKYWEFEDIKKARQIEYKIKRMKIGLSEEKVSELIVKLVRASR